MSKNRIDKYAVSAGYICRLSIRQRRSNLMGARMAIVSNLVKYSIVNRINRIQEGVGHEVVWFNNRIPFNYYNIN